MALAASVILALALAGLRNGSRHVQAAPGPVVFNNAPQIALPPGCSFASPNFAAGDVTGDGKQDLVMICGNSIVTLPGNGDGTFATASPRTTSLSNSLNGLISLADIDGDGKLDLVTDDFSCGVDVFLGNGDGTFQTPPVRTSEPDYCGSASQPFLVADLNGDGKPDLVLENIYGGIPTLTVFLNSSVPGTPSFVAESDVQVATSFSQALDGVAIGNFTGQVVPDLVVGLTTYGGSGVGTSNSVAVLKNNGSGTAFTAASTFTLPFTTNTGSLSGIAAGDFNGDGKVDLAAADPSDGAIFVLYGDGAGDLTSCSPSGSLTSIASCRESGGQTISGVPLGYSSSLLAGNFNGLPSLLFKNSNDGLSVLLGATGGVLQSIAGNYVAGQYPSGAVVADLNGDGAPDVIVPAGNGLSVFLNNTAGIFQGTQAFSAGASPGEIGLLQNFFGNGEQDLAVAQTGGNTITVLGAPAAGLNGTLPQSFGPQPVTFGGSSITALTSGCLDNSSPCAIPFVAVAAYTPTLGIASSYIITSGASGPSFTTTISTDLASQPVTTMAAGDFNGDGKTDLVFAFGNSGTIEVLAGNGDGTFSTSPETFSVGANPVTLAVADFNGDGKQDIAVLNQNGESVGILLNASSGSSVTFQTMATYPLSFSPLGMTVGDFNGDGQQDIAVVGQTAITILLNQGSGIFAVTAIVPAQGFYFTGAIGSADFNGDGKLDLAAISGNDTVQTFTGDGTGNFAATSPPIFSAGYGPNALAVADFNGDGKPDIAVADESGNMVSLLLSGTAAEVTPLPTSGAGFAQYSNTGPIEFGSVNVESSATQQFTLYNTGGTAFTISGISFSGASNAFSLTNVVCNGTTDFPFSSVNLGPEQFCTITLQFTPTSPGNGQAELLTILDSAGNSNASPTPQSNGQILLLAGDAVQPIASFSPTSVNFGSVNVGQGQQSGQILTLINTGNAPLMLDLLSLVNTGNTQSIQSAPFELNSIYCNTAPGAPVSTQEPVGALLGLTLGPGIKCAFNLTMQPTDQGTYNGILTFGDNAAQSNVASQTIVKGQSYSQTIPLTGTTPPAADVSVQTIATGPGFTGTAFAFWTRILSNGPESATNVTVTYSLSSPVQFGSLTGPGGSALSCPLPAAGNTVSSFSCNFGTFASASPAIFFLNLTPLTTGTLTLTTTITANQFDPNTSNNSSQASTTITSPAPPPSLPPVLTNLSFQLAPGSPVGVGSGPSSVATGDFNQDGIPDLAVVSANDNTVSVLIGNGDGTFKPAVTYVVNRNTNTPCFISTCSGVPISIVAASFRGNGILDLAITNIPINPGCSINAVLTGSTCAAVAILLGNGDGTFQPANQISLQGQLPTSIAADDFNGDEIADLAVTDLNSSEVEILLSNRDGTFSEPNSPLAVGNQPVWVAAGQFTSDGHQDLAVANAGDGTVSILLGNGNGTFKSPTNYYVGGRPVSVALANFTGGAGSGNLDLAIASLSSSTITILFGNGQGSFGNAQTYGVGGDPSSIAVGYFGGNTSVMDLAVADRLTNTVSVLFNTGNGSFAPPKNIPVGLHPQSLVAADFNLDNWPDIAIANAGSGTISVLLNVHGYSSPTAARPSPLVKIGSKLMSLILDPTPTTQQFVATISISNSGNSAGNIQVTGATLNGANSTSVPISSSLAPRGASNVTLNFPSTAGKPGASVLFTVKGMYSAPKTGGGTLSGSWTGSFLTTLPASTQ
ncbi:MAG: FG-GAP-like repeat-containing protein [Candidatus Acidiferrum sp.]